MLFPADLVTFTEDIRNGKLHFLSSVYLWIKQTRKDKYISLSNLSIYYLWKNTKKSYKNNQFKRSALTCNEESESPDGSYSISDIQDCFQYILKQHGEKTVNPSIKIYINKIENRTAFKIKT